MRTTLSILTLFCLNLGCSSASDDADGNVAADTEAGIDHTACLGTEMAFSLGQAVDGASGHFKMELVDVEPELGIDSHTLKVRLMTTDGDAVTGANFNLERDCIEDAQCTNTWQHVHKHVGGSEVTVEDNGDGLYTVSNLVVVHAGSWEFRFAPTAGGVEDYMFFHYCIEGDGSDGADHSDHADHSGHADHSDH